MNSCPDTKLTCSMEDETLSPLRGLFLILAGHPRLASWAAFLRRFAVDERWQLRARSTWKWIHFLEFVQLGQDFGAMLSWVDVGVDLGDLAGWIDQERVTSGEFHYA